jgi:Domain of unknown function (DUF4307)
VSSPDLLRQRYGRRGPSRPVLVLAVVVSALFLVWLAWVTWVHSTPEIESELIGYAVTDDHDATARVDVSIRGDGEGARCLVRATSLDHTPVGELSWEPTDGRNDVTIRTERRATTVELVGCTAPGQSRPR